MRKKIPIAKIKVTKKVTVQQRSVQRQQYQQHFEYESEPAMHTVNVAPLQREVKRLETAIKKTPRLVRLPVGVYPPHVEQLYDEIRKRSKPENVEKESLYDVFISHASEDKKDFVDPLVEALQNAGIRVWYDALELQWGKSLREQIDSGIKRSKYAILVLSKSFFAKKWPRRELDGIIAKEDITGASPLPIWYNITHADVYEFSPTLAGIYSFSSDRYSIDDICRSFKLILEKEPIKES